MCPFINIMGLVIPSYGLMIATGVVVANVIAVFLLKKTGQNFNYFIALEAYCILGAFIGAKLLYFIVSYKAIDWHKITDISYFNQLMQGGFVFYGGLIGGLLSVFLAGRLHKIEVSDYMRNFIFLIPFIHSFGRVGCFLAGCCYGIPYNGPGAVTFPEGSYAPAGISLFPVQLTEAVFLMIIAVTLLYLRFKRNCCDTIEVYLILYGFLRFGLEYFRYDNIRGMYAGLSTSQWISIMLAAAAAFSLTRRRSRRRLACGD